MISLPPLKNEEIKLGSLNSQVSKASKSFEGMASIQRIEEEDRRLQRMLPSSGADGQQSYERAALGQIGECHGAQV